MAIATAKHCANGIIRFCHEHGDAVTNLKLQKFLYYAQGWYLALYGEPLFDEDLQAWVHGPVQPRVYGAFKRYGYQPIDSCPSSLPPKEAVAHIAQVLGAYGHLSAWQLERLTHSEAPWQNARRGLKPDEPSTAVISKAEMRDFFRARLNG